MAGVGIYKNRRGVFFAASNAHANTTRGAESTESLDNALRVADQTALNTAVTAVGGNTADWVFMTIP